MRFSCLAAIVVSGILLTSVGLAASDATPTGQLTLEGGRAYPQRELTKWLAPGPSYRANIFGGAKVNVPMIGAVGLGLDFTYTDFKIKDMDGMGKAYYHRYLWDMFFLPISFGILNITPGIAWVVTDAKVEAWGLNEVSIRPAFVLSGGLHLGITDHLGLCVDVRGERVVTDHEELYDGETINLTGDFVTAMGGLMLYF